MSEMGEATHKHLLRIVSKPDWWPDNATDRFGRDCSCGCRFFHILDGARGLDWGVCHNPKSERVALLTFEHFGCDEFEYDDRGDEE